MGDLLEILSFNILSLFISNPENLAVGGSIEISALPPTSINSSLLLFMIIFTFWSYCIFI